MKKLRLYKKPSPLYVYRSELFWTAVTLLWLLFIYSNSMKTGEESSGQSQWVLSVIQRISGITGIGTGLTEHILRKGAHFGEYFVLGMLLTQTAKAYGFFLTCRLWMVPVAGFLMAAADETIQLFSAGRSAQFSDVLLDFCGVAAGMLLLTLFHRESR